MQTCVLLSCANVCTVVGIVENVYYLFETADCFESCVVAAKELPKRNEIR